MKIIPDCWTLIETFNCQFGAHLFDGTDLKIYVYNWLDVDGSIKNEFTTVNESGFVGHCLLVFKNVKNANINVLTHVENELETMWNDPISFNYSGFQFENTIHYDFEGSIQGFPSSASFSVDAQNFEIHILKSFEPAK